MSQAGLLQGMESMAGGSCVQVGVLCVVMYTDAAFPSTSMDTDAETA